MREFIIVLLFALGINSAADYYDLLGLSRDADNRQIRQAFKKLALTLHPDKNQNDPEANEKFIEINRAYEVLKDEELRKKYDVHGEDGLKDDFNSGRSGSFYHSWNYYYENFGIYDDDPEIITLSRTDFDQSVTGTRDVWFINFYSPACSHCHHLAPTWRQVARELEGVVRIGAVNCEEDWYLCRQEQINSYPSLVLYPQREKYRGERELRPLIKYVLKELSTHVLQLRDENLEGYAAGSTKPWVISLCSQESSDCPSSETMDKLSAMLDGLMHVATVDCVIQKTVCSKWGRESGVIYVPSLKNGLSIHDINTNDAKEIVQTTLGFLPEMISLDENEFRNVLQSLTRGGGQPWLVLFMSGAEVDLQLRKLPSLLSELKVGKMDCSRSVVTCETFFIKKYPTFILFKIGGGHEIHHGRLTPQDVAVFVQESALSSVETLGPRDFPSRVIDEGDTWFVDFYAPWCPPCMRLLPEWRKASRSVESGIHFGTVDCTVHQSLCQRYNIRSYPTSILYNQSVPHQYFGKPSAPEIVEFVKDILVPPVISLNHHSFESLIVNRPSSDIWLVEFFAPWCQPCQQLAPEWRKLAKMFANSEMIRVGQVDCTAESSLCDRQNVRSYPNVRLYPSRGVGATHFHVFNGWNRDADSIRSWAYQFLPSKVVDLDPIRFEDLVLRERQPSVVDFYAPWCGHCQTFAPEFESVAQELGDVITFAKVDCQQHRGLCQEAAVRAYPTVRFYPGLTVGKNIQSADDGDAINSQHAETIIGILRSKLEEMNGNKRLWPEDNRDIHDEL